MLSERAFPVRAFFSLSPVSLSSSSLPRFFTLEFRQMAFISKAHLISGDDAPYVDHHHLWVDWWAMNVSRNGGDNAASRKPTATHSHANYSIQRHYRQQNGCSGTSRSSSGNENHKEPYQVHQSTKYKLWFEYMEKSPGLRFLGWTSGETVSLVTAISFQ